MVGVGPMDKKGQALVEFILIMPVFLFILLALIDFGNIYHQKYKLENDLDFITNLYHDKQMEEIDAYAQKNEIDISYQTDDEFIKIELSKKVNIVTPGLNLILQDPYYITVDRYVYEK